MLEQDNTVISYKDKNGALVPQHLIDSFISHATRNGINIGQESLLFVPSYGCNTAKTKRWTSAYHGIPSMSESRMAFKPRYPNGFFLKGDFSQHELRIISSLCGDENMIEAFLQNKDLHKMVASKLYNVSEDEVTDNQRAVAKAANFGIVYLKTVPSFAQEYLGGDIVAAQKVFDAVFNTFPKLAIWRDDCIKSLHDAIDSSTGDLVRFPIYTMWGDPIWHEFRKSKPMDVIDAERYVVNWRVQSTASNLAGLALAETDVFLTENGYKTKPFGFTHDSEEFDTHPDEFFIMLDKIPEISERYLFSEFNLPVKIDIEIGTDLGSMVEFKRSKGKSVFIENGVASGVFSGVTKDVEAIIQKIRTAGYKLEEGKSSTKTKVISGSDIFSKKGTWHSNIGKPVHYKDVEVFIGRG